MDRTIQRLLVQELKSSAEIITQRIRIHPRFRVITPDGDYHIIIPQGDDGRHRWIKVVSAFMACKLARGYIVSALAEPESVFSLAVTRHHVSGYVCELRKDTHTLGPPLPFSPTELEPHYLKMLPKTISSIDGSTLAAVERCFGAVDPLLPHVFH